MGRSGFAEVAKQAMEQEGIVTKELNGISYTLKLLNSTQAWEIAELIIEFASPLLGRWIDGNIDNDLGVDLGILVSKNLKNLGGLEYWTERLLKDVAVKGQPVDFNKFIGSKGLKTHLSLIEWSLRENVLDFLLEWLEEWGLQTHMQKTMTPAQEKILEES